MTTMFYIIKHSVADAYWNDDGWGPRAAATRYPVSVRNYFPLRPTDIGGRWVGPVTEDEL